LSIKAKAVHESEIEDYLYNEFKVGGVKVFIAKELKMGDEVVIFQHPQLPFAKPSFGVIGVSIQH
jgi:hypothetical protein